MVLFIPIKILNEFTLQWHITVECEQSCRHCYMKDEKFYENQLKNPLNYEDIVKIIDEYVKFTNRWNLGKHIFFTGGDPLLRNDIFKILRYCKEKNIQTSILGNPFLLTREVALELEMAGLKNYQLSIDGMEKTHDELRSAGSFRSTLKALEMLSETNIKSHVMFTLSRKNKEDLFKVMDLMVEKKVDVFSFTRLVPVGSGKSLMKDMLSPEEFRDLFLEVLEKYRKYGECSTYFNRKPCNPWIILEKDLGLLTPNDYLKKEDAFLSRCPIGKHFCILADGTVLACRKLPIKIGKLPEQTFEEILLSKELKEIMEKRCIEKCKECKLNRVCIGCAAMAYAAGGDIKKPDPGCWW